MRKLIAISTALLLAACASAGTKVTQAQADSFVKGQTTKAQVIAQLGLPQSDVSFAELNRVTYLHVDTSIKGAT